MTRKALTRLEVAEKEGTESESGSLESFIARKIAGGKAVDIA